MRRLLSLLLLLALLLAGAWIGGETYAAAQLRQLSAAGLGFQAQSVSPLRNLHRIGIRLQDPQIQTIFGRIEAPQAVISVLPLNPMRARLQLPPTLALDLGQGPMPLELTDPRIETRLQPLAGFAPRWAHLSSGPVALDGRPLASGLSVDARMAALDAEAPQDAAAAYDVTWRLDQFDPTAFPRLADMADGIGGAGPVMFQGKGRVWLDTAPTPAALAAIPAPMPNALRIDEAQLSIGRLTARVIGQIRPDDQGRATGALALYSRDATPMLEAAGESGLIPKNAVRLAGAMIRSISAMPMPGEQTDGAPAAPGVMTYPRPEPGELRLPLIMADGRMSLGPIPLGPAPQLRP